MKLSKQNFKISIYVVFFCLFVSNLLLVYKLSLNLCKNVDTGVAQRDQTLVSAAAAADSSGNKAVVEFLKNLNEHNEEEIIDFEGFDNENGLNRTIVPNLVHLIVLQTKAIPFYLAINIYSIYLNVRPDFIFIHCDICSFEGHYWDEIQSIAEVRSRIKLMKIQDDSNTIFGTKFGEPQHKIDVFRLLILMQYGGIFMDNDVYAVRNYDDFRKFEMTLLAEYVEETMYGTQILIAHKNARFLRAYFDTYRKDYKPDQSSYNQRNVPRMILSAHEYLAKVVVQNQDPLVHHKRLFIDYWADWQKAYALHLLVSKPNNKQNFLTVNEVDEVLIKGLQTTYGEMVRDVLTRLQLLK